MDAGGLCAPIFIRPFWTRIFEMPTGGNIPRINAGAISYAGEKYAHFGLGPMRAVNTYTTGNSLVAACRNSDIRYILGFCAPTVIEDGGWEIAHYGSPLSPYFISDEDFRKPEAGERNDALMIASMNCAIQWSASTIGAKAHGARSTRWRLTVGWNLRWTRCRFSRSPKTGCAKAN